MKKILAIGLCFIGLVACKTQQAIQPPVQIPVHIKEKVVERLVPYALPADSTVIMALFECDSLNNVRLKELSELKAKGLQSGFTFNNGAFKYNLKQPPDTIYIPAKDSIIERDVPVLYYVPLPPVITNQLMQWQIVCIWFGKIFMGLLGLGAIILLLKWKLKF